MEAADGEAALNLMSGENVDIIITDWKMPKMDGLEFMKRIKSNKKLKNIPVLMVTAEASKQKVLEVIKAGVKSYIIKPFTAIQLQETIKKIIYPSTEG